jgi:DNA-binding MurR/RpiR family transcriptional regulator
VSLLQTLRDAQLTGSEKRVADLLISQPEAAAFGTVAELAATANVGGATVMRLATKLGFSGYRELQDAVQEELSRRLRPAAARIRQTTSDDPVTRAMTVEIDNVQRTLSNIDRAQLRTAVRLLSRSRHVMVLCGDAAIGVGTALATDLGMVRPHVELAPAGPLAVTRGLSWLQRGDVVVVIDVPRYDRAAVDAASMATAGGADVIAITDSALAPFAVNAAAVLLVASEGSAAFDSYVGVLALVNLLVAMATAANAEQATAHLDLLESTWTAREALLDE